MTLSLLCRGLVPSAERRGPAYGLQEEGVTSCFVGDVKRRWPLIWALKHGWDLERVEKRDLSLRRNDLEAWKSDAGIVS